MKEYPHKMGSCKVETYEDIQETIDILFKEQLKCLSRPIPKSSIFDFDHPEYVGLPENIRKYKLFKYERCKLFDNWDIVVDKQV